MSFTFKTIPHKWRGHFDMLADKLRNKAYSSSIMQASVQFSSSNNKNDIIVVDRNDGNDDEHISSKNSDPEYLKSDNESSIDTVSFGIDKNHRKYENCLTKEKDLDIWFEIGCGSGLLSCLLAKHLNVHIVAFECVLELAAIARENVTKNGLSDSIDIVSCHTDSIDPQYFTKKYGKAAKGCVSELLDTCFHGEGMFEGMKHSMNFLTDANDNHKVSSGLIMIPRSGKIFVQAFTGLCIANLESLDARMCSRLGVSICDGIDKCRGLLASTIHWSDFMKQGAVSISDRTEVFNFDFMNMNDGRQLDEEEEEGRGEKMKRVTTREEKMKRIELKRTVKGHPDAIVMWWECRMSQYMENNNTNNNDENLSNEAIFMNNAPGISPSPDHWRQAVFFQKPEDLNHEGGNKDGKDTKDFDNIVVDNYYDENDIWLSIVKKETENELSAGLIGSRLSSSLKDRSEENALSNHQSEFNLPPSCSCGVHSCSSCFRFKHMGEVQFEDQLIAMQSFVTSALESSAGDRNKRSLVIHIGDNVLAPSVSLAADYTRSDSINESSDDDMGGNKIGSNRSHANHGNVVMYNNCISHESIDDHHDNSHKYDHIHDKEKGIIETNLKEKENGTIMVLSIFTSVQAKRGAESVMSATRKQRQRKKDYHRILLIDITNYSDSDHFVEDKNDHICGTFMESKEDSFSGREREENSDLIYDSQNRNGIQEIESDEEKYGEDEDLNVKRKRKITKEKDRITDRKMVKYEENSWIHSVNRAILDLGKEAVSDDTYCSPKIKDCQHTSDMSCDYDCDTENSCNVKNNTILNDIKNQVTTTASTPLHVNKHQINPPFAIIGEPFFHDLQEEWALEHVLVFWQMASLVLKQNIFAPPEVFITKSPNGIPLGMKGHLMSSLLPSTSSQPPTSLSSTTLVTEPLIKSTLISPSSVEIWAAYFECDALFTHLAGEIGVCEGVDMSAINQLMGNSIDNVDVRQNWEMGNLEKNLPNLLHMSKVDSLRLAQWGAVICKESECCIGTINMRDVECSDSHKNDLLSDTINKQFDNNWRRSADLKTVSSIASNGIDSNLVDTRSSVYHGIVFWTVLKIFGGGGDIEDREHIGNENYLETSDKILKSRSCDISSHPEDHPESLQAVRCFQSPLRCDQDLSLKVFTKYSQGSFTVGVAER